MKLILFLLLFCPILFSQEKDEIQPTEFRNIQTEFTKEYIENYSDDFGGNPWSIPFEGCSWYCGGKIDSIISSTKCEHFNNNNIKSYSIHDFNYGTAWINSNEDNSKYIEYIFNKNSAKFTEIVIVNGNVKNDSLWNEYSRVKKIKMYINGKEFKTLKLEDTKEEQVYKFQPIGATTGTKSKKMKTQWSVRFEIIELYSGKKPNVAISEIYFEGDGHENE